MSSSFFIESFTEAKHDVNFVKNHVSVHFDWEELLKMLKAELPFPQLFVAVQGGQTIGMILLHTNIGEAEGAAAFSPEGSIWIYRLDVAPDFQGQGVGRALVQKVESYVQKSGHSELWLDTIQAADYYKNKLGYTHVGSAPYKDQQTQVFKKKLV